MLMSTDGVVVQLYNLNKLFLRAFVILWKEHYFFKHFSELFNNVPESQYMWMKVWGMEENFKSKTVARYRIPDTSYLKGCSGGERTGVDILLKKNFNVWAVMGLEDWLCLIVASQQSCFDILKL